MIVPLGESVLNRQDKDKKINIKVYDVEYAENIKRENFKLIDTIVVEGKDTLPIPTPQVVPS